MGLNVDLLERSFGLIMIKGEPLVSRWYERLHTDVSHRRGGTL